ncbi:MAG: circadian clock protein KaiB [Magnetococcales bacterium]|nr:circadian clock protein KaiB [Magnetococcales bacterium]
MAEHSKYLLKLYIAGYTSRSARSIKNLRRVCNEMMAGMYEIAVIDILDQPQLAEDEKILATPTLIKVLPPPMRRIIGDLSDREKVLAGLDILPFEVPFSQE